MPLGNIDGQYMTQNAGEDIADGVLVAFSSGNMVKCPLGTEWIGVCVGPVLSGNPAKIKLRGPVLMCKASGAFNQAAIVYGRANGLVDDISTTSAIRVGLALEAAGAANDAVAVMQC